MSELAESMGDDLDRDKQEPLPVEYNKTCKFLSLQSISSNFSLLVG